MQKRWYILHSLLWCIKSGVCLTSEPTERQLYQKAVRSVLMDESPLPMTAIDLIQVYLRNMRYAPDKGPIFLNADSQKSMPRSELCVAVAGQKVCCGYTTSRGNKFMIKTRDSLNAEENSALCYGSFPRTVRRVVPFNEHCLGFIFIKGGFSLVDIETGAIQFEYKNSARIACLVELPDKRIAFVDGDNPLCVKAIDRGEKSRSHGSKEFLSLKDHFTDRDGYEGDMRLIMCDADQYKIIVGGRNWIQRWGMKGNQWSLLCDRVWAQLVRKDERLVLSECMGIMTEDEQYLFPCFGTTHTRFWYHFAPGTFEPLAKIEGIVIGCKDQSFGLNQGAMLGHIVTTIPSESDKLLIYTRERAFK